MFPFAFVVLAQLFLGSCQVRNEAQPSVGAGELQRPSSRSQRWKNLWQNYRTDRLQHGGLIEGCSPSLQAPAAAQTPQGARGVVVFYHGFTMCPKQLDEFVIPLLQAGFFVMTPLLRGHGLKAHDNDPVANKVLPRVSEGGWRAYLEDASRVNEIVAEMKRDPELQGNDGRFEAVMMGFSLGGAVALRSVMEERGLYERLLAIAPLLELGRATARTAAAAVEGVAGVAKNVVQGHGANCPADNAAGRAGYCRFSMDQLSGARRFGVNTAESLSTQTGLRVQLVGTEGDKAVSLEALRSAEVSLSGRSDLSFCLYDEKIKHAFISPAENRAEFVEAGGTRMNWLEGLRKNVVNFAKDGQEFAVGGSSAHPSRRGTGAIPRCKRIF